MLLNSDTQLNQKSYYEASVTRPPVEPLLQGAVMRQCLFCRRCHKATGKALKSAIPGMNG